MAASTQERSSIASVAGPDRDSVPSISIALRVLQLVRDADLSKLDAKTRKKILPILFIGSLALSACSAISTDQISQYQGSFSGVQDVGVSSQAVTERITYTTGFKPVVEQALDSYSETQVRGELEQYNYNSNVEAHVRSGNATVSLQRIDSPNGKQQVDTPYQITISPTGDGSFVVEITGQECANTNQGRKCTTPATSLINGQFDIYNPSVAIGKPAGSADGSGVIVSGRVSDGQGSGIQGTTISTCDNSAAASPQVGPDGSVAAIFQPKQGDNCYVVRATDRVGHNGQSEEVHFTYSLTGNVNLQRTPDGKVQAVGTGTNTLNAPVSVALSRCDTSNVCTDLEATIPVTNGAYASKGFPPALGENHIVAWFADRFGNRTSVQANLTYEFAMGGQALVESTGTVKVETLTKNNMYPNFTVTIEKCDDPASKKQATVNPDGSAAAAGFIPNVGDTCLRAIASDPNRTEIKNDFHVSYSFDPGEIHQQIDYRDKGAALYLFGDPPPNVDPATFTASGSQPDWRSFGKVIDFSCSNLGGDVTINGKKWAYTLVCDLPANAGDATLHLNFTDRTGHEFGAYYPLSAKKIIDLQDHPDPMQLAFFLAPYIAGLAVTGSASGFGTAKGYRHLDRKERGKRAKTYSHLAMRGDMQQAEAFIDRPRKIFRVRPDERQIYTDLVACWTHFQTGKYDTAFQLLDKVDVSQSPELTEVKRIFANGIIDQINQKLASIEREKNASRLSYRDINQLMRQVDSISASAVWELVEYNRGRQALEYVSSFRLANQSYVMPLPDFKSRHERLWQSKDERSVRGLKRMVHLLCYWRNFAAAEEFMGYLPPQDRVKFKETYRREFNMVKQEFGTLVATTDNSNLRLHDGTYRLLSGMSSWVRLTGKQSEEFTNIIRIESSSRTGDHASVLSQVRELLLINMDDYALISNALQRSVQFASREIGELSASHDVRKMADPRTMRLISSVSRAAQEPWWLFMPSKDKDTLTAQADEIMLVHLGRTERFEVFERAAGPLHMRDRAHLERLVGTLVAWKDLKSALACIDAFPVEKDRKELRDSFRHTYLEPVIRTYVNAIRKGGAIQYRDFLSDYVMPDGLEAECKGIGEIEMAITSNNFAGALSSCSTFIAGDAKRLELVTDSLVEAMKFVAAKWEPVFKFKQLSQLQDNTLRGEALMISRLKAEPWWGQLKYSEKNAIVMQAEQLTLVGMAQAESPASFIAAVQGSRQTKHQMENLVEMLCDWRDYSVAEACIAAFPQAESRRAMRETFEKTRLMPLRAEFMEALQQGYTYASFFSGFKLPADLNTECRSLERLVNAGRKKMHGEVLREGRALVVNHPERITLVQGTIDATLNTLYTQWSKWKAAKARSELGDTRVLDLATIILQASREPWWEHQLVSGSKDLVQQLAGEFQMIGYAQAYPFSRFQRDFSAQFRSADSIGQMADILGEWGDMQTAYEAIETISQPQEKTHARERFWEKHVTPAKNAYLAAYEESPARAAEYFSSFRMHPAIAQEFSDLRGRADKWKNWKANDLPAWHFPEYVQGDLRKEVINDVAKTCHTALFNHEIPFDSAVVVTKRWFDTVYFIDGPFVPMFLGMTGADVAAAKRAGDYYPMIASMRRSMMSLLTALDGYSSIVSQGHLKEQPLQKRVEMLAGYLIHDRIMEWFLPLKSWVKDIPTRTVGSEKVPYGEVSKLTYNPVIDPSDVEKAMIELWKNWIFELLNNQLNGEPADIFASYKKLGIKPIINPVPGTGKEKNGIQYRSDII